jgi:hypothetical protein
MTLELMPIQATASLDGIHRQHQANRTWTYKKRQAPWPDVTISVNSPEKQSHSTLPHLQQAKPDASIKLSLWRNQDHIHRRSSREGTPHSKT